MSIAISVIIPYYQGKRYLPDLRSMMERNAEIFRKETGKEIEVLLVNDSPWEKIEPELKPWGNSSVPYRLKVLTNSQNSGIHATRVNGLNAAPGEDVVVSAVFTADRDISDPVIRLQIGNAPEGAASNKITFKDLVFGTRS